MYLWLRFQQNLIETEAETKVEMVFLMLMGEQDLKYTKGKVSCFCILDTNAVAHQV